MSRSLRIVQGGTLNIYRKGEKYIGVKFATDVKFSYQDRMRIVTPMTIDKQRLASMLEGVGDLQTSHRRSRKAASNNVTCCAKKRLFIAETN